jgi:MoaA/NifB/PqqE/SkfB family radical SAM enzyme
MKKIIKIEHTQKNRLTIDYELGNRCNYKCNYCTPDSYSGTHAWPDVDVVKKNIVSLINYYSNNLPIDNIRLTLSGGEPTLWRDLGEFAKYIHNNTDNKKVRIKLLTNGSRTLRWWEEYADYFTHIGISIHHEAVDVDHIIKLSEILNKKRVSFITEVLMDLPAWDKCVSIVDKLLNTNNRFMVSAKPVYFNGQVSNYSIDQQKYLKTSLKRFPSLKNFIANYNKLFSKIPTIKTTFDDGSTIKTKNENYFVLNMLNRFNGYECDLGVSSMFIDKNGRITGACFQKLYNEDFYYNINDVDFSEKFKPNLVPVICTKNICPCVGENIIPKRKI